VISMHGIGESVGMIRMQKTNKDRVFGMIQIIKRPVLHFFAQFGLISWDPRKYLRSDFELCVTSSVFSLKCTVYYM
jgi:hypothetical protein